MMDSGERKERLNFDLNLTSEECLSELGFQDRVQSGHNYPEKQTESESSGDLRIIERFPDGVTSGFGSKRTRYTVEEKGKAKMEDNEVNLDLDLNLNLNLNLYWRGLEEERGLSKEQVESRRVIDMGSSTGDYVPKVLDSETVGELDLFPVHVERNSQMEKNIVPGEADLEVRRVQALASVRRRRRKIKEEASWQRQFARDVAQRFARLDPPELQYQQPKKQQKKRQLRVVDEELNDSQNPFLLAMEAIKSRQNVEKRSLGGLAESLFKWVPANNKRYNGLKRDVPMLLDISLNALAKNADLILSLDLVPDVLKHRISHLVSDARKVDAHFVELLASGSPTEIRVRDISQLTEEEFTKIFGGCHTKDLTVLQLDLCGRCMPDYVLHDTLARSSQTLAALATLSLRGAHRLSDIGLTDLAKSAPALQSINLSQCSLLTSQGISDLATRFESTLRELYIDDCQNIDAMIILPALKKVKHLEVLSVAGIQTVSDDFVIEMVEVCGQNMKELIFANCVELTDISIKIISKTCPRLCALDLSYLHNLTDSSLQYLANGCRSIHRLILCRNDFSDEAIATFLEASGESLNVLSLNNIRRVALSTALSIATCLRNLLSLDLSWCRKLTDEALGLIVDSCLSLKLLKLFGCTQITDVFLNGHSNPLVQIVGGKTKPLLEHLDVLEPQTMPLRYSSLKDFSNQQNVDSPTA